MMNLTIKGTDYKVRFTYNAFCDTDLMDRTSQLIKLFKGDEIKNDNDVLGMGMIKELFSCTRELLFVGLSKDNPVESVQAVGDLLDDYYDENTSDDKALGLFAQLTEELMSNGFFGELMKQMISATTEVTKPSPKKKK